MRKVRWYQYFINPIVWFFAQLYRLVAGSLSNIFGNLFAVARLIKNGNLKNALRDWKAIKKNCENFEDFAVFYGLFKYEYDGLTDKPLKHLSILNKFPTWTSLPFITVANGVRGNCQDASFLAKVMLRKYKDIQFTHNIYVPINPIHLDKVHYIVTIKIEGITSQLSNGKITEESRDRLANRYLNNAGRKRKINYVWI